MVEIEFGGGGSRPLYASVVPHLGAQGRLGAQALATASCATLGPAISQGTVDLAGKHYLQATFPVTNNCGRDLNNLTYVATRRIDATPTIGGTAITLMTTATGADADPTLAAQIMPTQAINISGSRVKVDQDHASLQVFDDFDGSELDSFQAAVDPTRTTYDLLPYGFVATTTPGARLIPNGGSGAVTFAVSLPIQLTPAQDVYTFRLLLSPGTNNIPTITQGLEEQDSAGRAGVIGRAAKFSFTEVRTLLGPNLTPANVAPGGRVVCQVRTAGPRGAATATLVNAVGNVSISNISRPLVLGGAQNQPVTVVTYAGKNFLSRSTFFNPNKLGITSNYLHPTGIFPLTRQTASVQASACNQLKNFNITTSPYNILAATQNGAFAVSSTGGVIRWGFDFASLTTIPPEAQSGVVAVTGSDFTGMALKTDGSIFTYGGGSSYPVPVAAQSGVISTALAGADSMFALKSDGSVIGWGSNMYKLTTIPLAAQSGVSAIAGGPSGTMLALKANGGVVAWGDQSDGKATVPAAALSGVIGISASHFYNLALKNDGSVIGWGYNGFGTTTIPLTAKSNVIAIAAGYYHALALKNDGSVVAWGSYDKYSETVVPVAAQSDVVAIAAGSFTSYALKADGSIVAWGLNDNDQTTVPAGTYQTP